MGLTLAPRLGLAAEGGYIGAPVRTLLPIAVALVIAAAALLMLDPLVRQMLYPAPPIPVPSPPPSPLVEVALELASGERVVAWAHDGDAGGPAVVFFHGNGENLETMRFAGLYDQLAALGTSFLAVDYPGYGRSSGTPSEASLTASGEAAFEWLAERHGGAPKVVLGWSLGAAVAIQTAARKAAEVDGVVLLSAWADLRSLAAVHYPSWLVGLGLSDAYDSVAAARSVRAPVLMIHGAADRIIPIGQGRRLHAALGSSSRFVEVPRAGHNDLLAQPVVWQELAAFLRQVSMG